LSTILDFASNGRLWPTADVPLRLSPRESAKNFCFSTPARMTAFAIDASIAAK